MAVTPNMLLPLDPYVGQSNATPGPQWASDIETTKGLVDLHTHGAGKGSPIISLQPPITGVSFFVIPTPTVPITIYEVISTPSFRPTVTLPSASLSAGALIIIKDSGGAGANNWVLTTSDIFLGGGVTVNVTVSLNVYRTLVIAAGTWTFV